MAILKARENSSDTFTPVATMGVGNASQSQRGLMTAQDKVKLDTLVNLLVPVGVILTFANDINPNNIYAGTTWQKIEGKFLLGSSSIYALGDTGGEATHTLSSNEMPIHNHRGKIGYNQTGHGYTPSTYEWIIAGGSHTELLLKSGSSQYQDINQHQLAPTDSAGGNQSHNNMPPYEVVNYWKRTA